MIHSNLASKLIIYIMLASHSAIQQSIQTGLGSSSLYKEEVSIQNTLHDYVAMYSGFHITY